MVEVNGGKKAPIEVYKKNVRGWSPTDLGTKVKA
jgi:hypothetical protein